MTTEKIIKPMSGYGMLFLALIALVIGPLGIIFINPVIGVLCLLFFVIAIPGFVVIPPNEAKVLTLFGKYKGSVTTNGLHWVNPLYVKRGISLRARNFNSDKIKVNDKVGNPIEIAAVIVWQVTDTAKAVFDVDAYLQYVNVQSESAIRHLAGAYPYDNFEDDNASITLRGGGDQVNEMLEKELNDRLERAGIKILEARISHLAYAAEIAGAMLQRQQATAVVSARKQIVEGAVGMVEMALNKLSEKDIVALDNDKKATMVSNLMVVLCGDRNVTPVLNTGNSTE